MMRRGAWAILAALAACTAAPDPVADLVPFCTPPADVANDLGSFRSPLLCADGRRVAKADEWPRRRAEILETWHRIMGPWPPLVAEPTVGACAQTCTCGCRRWEPGGEVGQRPHFPPIGLYRGIDKE